MKQFHDFYGARIHKNLPTSCETHCIMLSSCRTTHCHLSTAICAVYLQLPSIFAGRLIHPQYVTNCGKNLPSVYVQNNGGLCTNYENKKLLHVWYEARDFFFFFASSTVIPDLDYTSVVLLPTHSHRWHKTQNDYRRECSKMKSSLLSASVRIFRTASYHSYDLIVRTLLLELCHRMGACH